MMEGTVETNIIAEAARRRGSKGLLVGVAPAKAEFLSTMRTLTSHAVAR